MQRVGECAEAVGSQRRTVRVTAVDSDDVCECWTDSWTVECHHPPVSMQHNGGTAREDDGRHSSTCTVSRYESSPPTIATPAVTAAEGGADITCEEDNMAATWGAVAAKAAVGEVGRGDCERSGSGTVFSESSSSATFCSRVSFLVGLLFPSRPYQLPFCRCCAVGILPVALSCSSSSSAAFLVVMLLEWLVVHWSVLLQCILLVVPSSDDRLCPFSLSPPTLTCRLLL